MLTAASASVALLPFRKAIRFGCVRPGRVSLAVDDCIWAVETAARRLPWRTMCIEQGLAAQRMLRRAGIDAVLHYGARQGGELESHVWVSVGGQPVLGADEFGFAEITTFP